MKQLASHSIKLAFLALLVLSSLNAWALTISGQVLLYGAPKRGVKIYASDGLRATRTDKNGNYSIKVSNPGTYLISVLPGKDYIPQTLSRSVTVESSDVSALDFALLDIAADKGAIYGRVAVKGKGVQGVLMRVPEFGEAQTDKNGIFLFSDLNPGRYFVYPAIDGYTFGGGAVKSIKLRGGKSFKAAYSGKALESGDNYATYFPGVWNAALSVTSTNCPTDQTALDGLGTITQSKDKVRVKLPRLGTYSGGISQNTLQTQISTLKLLCRVSGPTGITFSDINHGAVSGQLEFKCLLADPCTLTFSGTIERK